MSHRGCLTVAGWSRRCPYNRLGSQELGGNQWEKPHRWMKKRVNFLIPFFFNRCTMLCYTILWCHLICCPFFSATFCFDMRMKGDPEHGPCCLRAGAVLAYPWPLLWKSHVVWIFDAIWCGVMECRAEVGWHGKVISQWSNLVTTLARMSKS